MHQIEIFCPSIRFPLPAICAKSSSLSPSPKDDDVQNGITVFPSKLLPSTGHVAIPHQIG